MEIDFNDLENHVIPMNEFSLKWRFIDENYRKLSDEHLSQLKPLDSVGANFLWNFISKTNLHADIPFKKDFFKVVDKTEILMNNEQEVRKWLYRRGFPFDKKVYLSYQPNLGMIVPWKLLIKYFDDFYYSIADDLTVIDRSLNWALLFFHEHEIYFGSNEKYKSNEVSEDTNFLW